MTRHLKIATAFLLAAAMFVAGALLLAPRNGRSGPDGTRPRVGTEFLSQPALSPESVDRTIASLEASLGDDDDDWAGWATLGAAYIRKARLSFEPRYFEEAERALGRSIALEADNLIAVPAMGELANARHEFAVARAWAGRALELNPASPVAHGILGDAQLNLGRYDAAFKTYQRMVDLRPGLPSYSRVAYARELVGDIAGATRAMRAALRAAGPDPYTRAWALTEIAGLMGTGDGAERTLRAALDEVPSFAEALVGLARIDVARGNLERAVTRMERVVRLQPLPDDIALLGDLYAEIGRERAAAVQYRRALEREELARANGVRYDFETPLFLATQRIDLDRALDVATDLYRARKTIHNADAYAWTLHVLGRDRQAWPVAKAALRLGTREASFHYHAGEIARALGKDEIARRYLTTALRIDPFFSVREADDARRALAALRS